MGWDLTNKMDLRRPARTAGREVPLWPYYVIGSGDVGKAKVWQCREACENFIWRGPTLALGRVGTAHVQSGTSIVGYDYGRRRTMFRCQKSPTAAAEVGVGAVVGDDDVGEPAFFLDGPLGGFAAGEFGVGPAAWPGAFEPQFPRRRRP